MKRLLIALLALSAGVAQAQAHPRPRAARPSAWVGASKFHEADSVDTIVIARTAKLYGHPDPRSMVVGVAQAGERLHRTRVSSDGRWSLVDAGGGEVAWVETAASRPATSDAPAAPPPPILDDTPPPAATAPPPAAAPPAAQEEASIVQAAPPRATSGFSISAGAGLTIITQRFVSDGPRTLSSYQYTVDSATVRVALGYRRGFAGRYFFGIDGAYAWAGGGALRYPAADASAQVAFDEHDADAGLGLGVRVDALGGLELKLRAGGRMTLHVIGVQPSLQMPSDRLLGFTAGLWLDAPSVATVSGMPIGLALFGEGLLAGSLSQAAGLGDGTPGASFGGRFGGALSLGVLPRGARGHLAVLASYCYQIDVTHFSGPTSQDPAVTTSALGSAAHQVLVALVYDY